MRDPGFHSMPTRVASERTERLELAKHALAYQIAFLDDCLRAILPHDLVLIGAPTGLGKTEMSLGIAMANAVTGKRVAYFALEAEENELERRTKYKHIVATARRRSVPGCMEINYSDWLLGRCEEIIGSIDHEANQFMLSRLSGLRTYYRGQHFDQADLRREVELVHAEVDLIIIDHLHYIDFDDDASEAKAVGDTVKAIRDVSLRIGKPVILVAHLRKKNHFSKQLVPTIDDFHGSSNITKICTQAITIERAPSVEIPDLKWWQAPTFMSILKDRRLGAPPYVALLMFDKRSGSYDQKYTLGRLTDGGSKWEQVVPGDAPSWAKNHRPLEVM